MRHWPDILEAPLARRRGELVLVCAGVVAGWIGLVGLGVSMLG